MRLIAAIAFLLAAAAMAPGDGDAEATSTAPAAGAEPAAVDKTRLGRYVQLLASQAYRQRKEAREELQRMLNHRGAAEEMRRLLADSRDPEVRLVLDGLLETYGQPLLMVWARGAMQTYAGSKRFMRMDPGFPWLLVCGDGTFTYDAASPIFAGKAGELMETDFRQGKLTVDKLYALMELIDASGVPRMPAKPMVQGATDNNTVEVIFHARSGQLRRSSYETWALSALAKGKKAPAPKSDEGLVVAARELLAATESAPYEGPYRAFARYEPVRDRNQVPKLPDWPVAGADIPQMMQQGGVELSAKQLQEAREALAKTQVFKYATHAACRIWLIPHVEKARELYYGTAK